MVVTVAAVGGISDLLWFVAGDRYAEDVIRDFL